MNSFTVTCPLYPSLPMGSSCFQDPRRFGFDEHVHRT
ncbi:uncharacterized protein [Blastocystis hominis]|uniref:Uncharacterized protein n=1 Tax=Blastocystis hominis TaxID=12968 RepID=D8LVJ9_BLAHO|nr:uncharacterized protein [Blastocystis hominis]CBK19838.2 unnamed protein product [Blastocystis hominis]|eukprot:XP_012893886.1 uncharacterized protein [Blastocystis hominis]